MVRILFGVHFEWWVEKLAKPRERKRTHGDPNFACPCAFRVLNNSKTPLSEGESMKN